MQCGKTHSSGLARLKEMFTNKLECWFSAYTAETCEPRETIASPPMDAAECNYVVDYQRIHSCNECAVYLLYLNDEQRSHSGR